MAIQRAGDFHERDLKRLDLPPEQEPEEAYEEIEFRTDRSLETPAHDVKALELFREHFLVGKFDIDSLKILVVNPGNNASAQVVFKDSRPKTITRTRAHADFLGKKHYDSEKADPKRRKFGGGAFNVVIALDPSTEPTPRFLYNIASNGFLLCRARTANKLRKGDSTFHIVDVIDPRGSLPRLAEDPLARRKAEVSTDDQFQKASKLKTEGVVTYEEAEQALKDAHWPVKGGVLESYRKLLEEAEKDSKNEISGQTLNYQNEKMKKSIELKREIPFGEEEEDDDKIFVLRQATIH